MSARPRIFDRSIKSPDGRGHQWDTVYDPNGNPLLVGLTVGGAYLDGHSAAWDDLDRLERKVDYAGNATLTEYNVRGLENAVASGTRFTGSVQGVAQVTGRGTNIDHGVRSVFEAQKLVKTQGGTAYLDTSVSKLGITGTAKNYVPDVIHEAAKGRINTLEVASVSQQKGNRWQYLTDKQIDIQNALSAGQKGSYDVIKYDDARVGVGEVFDAFYGSYVNGALAGYQGLKAFTASEPVSAAPYSGSNSGGVRLGK